MKNAFTVLIVLVSFASFSPAADFSPTVMTITCPEALEYFFDGDPLTIPFTIEGVGGAVWLVINTRWQAENIRDVRNGHLGWHYVNRIDTTVYVSPRYERDKGSAEIVWDGKDQNGNPVERGNYDYYLWAYDDNTDRKLATSQVTIANGWDAHYNRIYELGEDGMPLAQPLIMGGVNWIFVDDSRPHLHHGVHYKWELGGDPNDLNNLQTTRCAMYDHGLINTFSEPDWCGYGGPVFHPGDYNTFYHASVINTTDDDGFYQRYFTLLKWEFIDDGDAVFDQEWLGWEEATWRQHGSQRALSPCYTDRNYIYIPTPVGMSMEDDAGTLRCVSFDGDVVFEKVMHDWYMPNETRSIQVGQASDGTPIVLAADPNIDYNKMYSRGDNRWLLLAKNCCLFYLLDTSRLIEDPADESDMVVFENRNGDYFLDVGYEPTSDPAWFCVSPGYGYSMVRESACIDANRFNIVYVSYLGLTSFAVSTQDGTRVDYMSFADESVTDDISKGGGQLIDSGSNYDGLYMNKRAASQTDYWFDNPTTYFVAFDSAHGTIDWFNEVEEKTPAVFRVEQNVPNPFNPATTIAFTLHEASRVQVAVYNVAGQKVATLADNFMTAGQHAVTWDASDFSAGVYFCLVKAGGHEKTVKMTIVK